MRENGTTLLAQYGYDPLSRRVSLTYGNGATASYTYELDDDLTGLTHSLTNETVAFTYASNARGQRTSQSVNNALYLWQPAAGSSTSYTANVLNQYTTVDAVSYSYDANGNLTDDGVLTYGYDAEGHLTSVTGTGVSASYVYDALGRRRSQTVGATTTEYLYDGARVIAAFDAAGNRLRRFVYGPGLDEPLALIGFGGAIHYYHQDGLGSVIALSDSTGNVAERYAYGPFGQTATVSLLGNPYRYTGRRYDEATGLYHYRARAYSAPLGRFLQPDPIGYGDGLNLYAYVGNDPINRTDPTGLFFTPDTALDIAFIVYDVTVLVTNPSWVAAGALALDTVGAVVPILTGAGAAYRSTAQLTDIANRADRIDGPPGTTAAGGAARHRAAERMVNNELPGFSAEETYLNGRYIGQQNRARGSSVADVIRGTPKNPASAYDFKFGASGMRPGQMAKYRRNLPPGVPVTVIRPGFVLVNNGFGAAINTANVMGSLFIPSGALK